MEPRTLFKNLEFGIESIVSVRQDGRFMVSLRDIDADEVVPYVVGFGAEADAIAYARKLVAGARRSVAEHQRHGEHGAVDLVCQEHLFDDPPFGGLLSEVEPLPRSMAITQGLECDHCARRVACRTCEARAAEAEPTCACALSMSPEFWTGRCGRHARMMKALHDGVWSRETPMWVFRDVWAFSDGYGEPGHIPPQGYDWSGMRDSSPEAVEKMHAAMLVALGTGETGR